MGRCEEDPPLASRGTVDAALLEEHPGLYIRWLEVDRGSGRGVSPSTAHTALVVIGVAGVPEIAVEEALWIAAEILGGA